METIDPSYQPEGQLRQIMTLAERLCLPESIDRHLGTHGLHRGLSNGWLATTWLACILCTGDHRKSKVKDWVDQHHQALECILQRPIRPIEFSDGRLGILLRRLSDVVAWRGVERDLWERISAIRGAEVTGVRVYSTTIYGPGATSTSEEARLRQADAAEPGSPSVYLAVAVGEPDRHIIASEVYPAHLPANPCCPGLTTRVHQMLGERRLLYSGDEGMAELEVRASIVIHADDYLVALPAGGRGTAPVDPCVQQAIDGHPPAQVVEVGGCVVGTGFEVQRGLKSAIGGGHAGWTERVQIVRSLSAAYDQTSDLVERLRHAENALRILALTSAQGKRLFKDETAIKAAITRVLSEYEVEGLLQVTWRRQDQKVTSYVGRGRGGPNRPVRTLTQTQYAITHVWRDQEAVDRRVRRLGWHAQATSLSTDRLPTRAALARCYTEGARATGNPLFALPLHRVGPLHLRRDDQAVGLTCLLVLSSRLQALLRAEDERCSGERRTVQVGCA